MADHPNVLQFPSEPVARQWPRGTHVLAALILVLRAFVQLAEIAAIAGLLLLAAVGALTLLGR